MMAGGNDGDLWTRDENNRNTTSPDITATGMLGESLQISLFYHTCLSVVVRYHTQYTDTGEDTGFREMGGGGGSGYM